MKEMNIRLAVGSASGRHSATWAIFTRKNDVYATHRTQGKVEKISFHESLINRRAFIAGQALPAHMEDRVIDRWTRAKTPTAGRRKAIALLTVEFPETHLSREIGGVSSKTIWLPARGAAMTTFMRVILTRDGEVALAGAVAEGGASIVAYHQLPNGEAVAVLSSVQAESQPSLVMPASHGESRDLALPAQSEPWRPRPVGLTMFDRRNELHAVELTGFYLPGGKGFNLYPNAARFDRNANPIRSKDLLVGGTCKLKFD